MFIGHFAVGFAGKAVAPRSSLGVLLGSAMLLDLIWPIFLVAGWEQVRIAPGDTAFTPLAFTHYPWSHSLASALVWAALAAIVYGTLTGYRAGSLVAGAAVFSHWALDWVTHRPDLPLYPGSATRVGLSLWNSVAGTVVVELVLFAAGLALYVRAAPAVDRAGRYGLAAFVLVTLAIYAGSLLDQAPPSLTVLKAIACAAWLFPLWAAQIDRHRGASA